MRHTLKRWIGVLLAVCLVAALVPAALATDVTDIGGHANETALQAFVDRGYLLGYGDGTGAVRPDQTITRAEFAALVNRVAGYRIKSADMGAFADVPADTWYYSPIAIAYEAGYMIGKSNTAMDPTGTITAQEVDIVISRLAGTESTVTDTTALTRAEIVQRLYDKLDAIEGKGAPTGEVYVLMNIPYAAFYGAEGATIADVDAVSSATNKTGNYGKAGGAYHSGVTARIAEDGSFEAVGGENGSQVQGVIWPVKADVSVLETLGGVEVTDETRLTTATLGRGAASTNTLVGYETLNEQPDYSYYYLSAAPSYYFELSADGSVSAMAGEAVKEEPIEVPKSYGTRWGDIQINIAEAADASDKMINAMVLTAANGTVVGLWHLDQIWSYSDIAWKVANTPGLDGTTITGIRYYCSVKDDDLTDAVAPAYANYVYDYPVNVEIPKVYTGEVTAAFVDANTITVSGLPEDIENPTATVYYTTGGRGATYEYLTPLVVDPADDDIDPKAVAVDEDGKITFAPDSVTNNAGTTQNFGTPEAGKTYTVELSSDNYILNKITVEYAG